MRIKKFVAPALLAILIGSLLIRLPIAIAQRAADYEWFDPIVTVRALLLEHFVEEPDEARLKTMHEAMIGAMVASLEDPYTEYVPPVGESAFNKQLRGAYVGIGAEIDIVDEYLTIVTPMDDSPALDAGIMAGDTVLEIEGVSTKGKSTEECIEILAGDPGQPVTLRVRHADGIEEEITLVRRRIVTHTVKGVHRIGENWEYRIDPELGIGYVRITLFNETTAGGVQRAMDELAKADLNGLIIDLRFDPGGELDAAVAIADLFLEKGVIVSIRGRSSPERTYEARPEGTLPAFPIVVLVNEGSASASEILAGALQENARAKVLGERTYGKGSVQEVRTLPDRMGTLKMTTAHYYLASGRNLHRTPDSITWGVDPDPGFAVEMSDDQYREMIQSRRQYEIINRPGGNGDAKWADPAWIEGTVKDVQLARALAAVQARVRGEEWPRVGGDSGALAALDEEYEQGVQFRNRLAAELEQADDRLREMRTHAELAGRETLLPQGSDVSNGTLTLKDANGNVVAVYRVTDGNLEQALSYARVERVE